LQAASGEFFCLFQLTARPFASSFGTCQLHKRFGLKACSTCSPANAIKQHLLCVPSNALLLDLQANAEAPQARDSSPGNWRDIFDLMLVLSQKLQSLTKEGSYVW
jgi:hypothetical protein